MCLLLQSQPYHNPIYKYVNAVSTINHTNMPGLKVSQCSNTKQASTGTAKTLPDILCTVTRDLQPGNCPWEPAQRCTEPWQVDLTSVRTLCTLDRFQHLVASLSAGRNTHKNIPLLIHYITFSASAYIYCFSSSISTSYCNEAGVLLEWAGGYIKERL